MLLLFCLVTGGRGVQAPAADHKGSQQALEQTFTLTNISPQVGKGFNRRVPDVRVVCFAVSTGFRSCAGTEKADRTVTASGGVFHPQGLLGALRALCKGPHSVLRRGSVLRWRCSLAMLLSTKCMSHVHLDMTATHPWRSNARRLGHLRLRQVFVVTGPLFLPRLTPRGYTMAYPLIGEVPNLVAVPTHFFKVVLAESKSRNMLGAKPVCPPPPQILRMPLSFSSPEYCLPRHHASVTAQTTHIYALLSSGLSLLASESCGQIP